MLGPQWPSTTRRTSGDDRTAVANDHTPVNRVMIRSRSVQTAVAIDHAQDLG